MGIRLILMDRATLIRDGQQIHLEPRIMAVLIRLALEVGKPVRDEELLEAMRQPLPAPRGTGSGSKSDRSSRVHLYKCVHALRRALDPDQAGKSSIRLLRDPGPNPGYRLELDQECIDLFEFENLFMSAVDAQLVSAARQLRRAVELWRGRPLVDVADRAWAQPWIKTLHEQYDQARHRLLDIYETFGQPARAIELARSLLADQPHDHTMRLRLDQLRTRLAGGTADIAHQVPGTTTTVRVRLGDLFDQHDAHLVIGFSDTFETNTTNDFLVSRASVQGQLVHRLYSGDHRTLDRQLRAALKHLPGTREDRTTKRYGKRIRYPVGTVAVVHQGGRRLFAVAYSRVSDDGWLAQSSVDRLGHSLEQLWLAIRQSGQHRPIAMALVGSGLARIDQLDRYGFLELILGSFLTHTAGRRITDELRIVLHPTDAALLDPTRIDEIVQTAIGGHPDAARSPGA